MFGVSVRGGIFWSLKIEIIRTPKKFAHMFFGTPSWHIKRDWHSYLQHIYACWPQNFEDFDFWNFPPLWIWFNSPDFSKEHVTFRRTMPWQDFFPKFIYENLSEWLVRSPHNRKVLGSISGREFFQIFFFF